MLLRGIISENYVNHFKDYSKWGHVKQGPPEHSFGKNFRFAAIFLKKIHTYHYNCLLYSTQQQQHMNCGRKINIMYTKEFLLAVTNVSVGRQQQASRQDVKQDKEKITC